MYFSTATEKNRTPDDVLSGHAESLHLKAPRIGRTRHIADARVITAVDVTGADTREWIVHRGN
jgi:hypothetical protein